MISAEQLFKDYCFYRDETVSIKKLKAGGQFFRPMKFTKEREALFNKLISWCGEKQIPVRQWLYTLFVIRRWMFAPKLTEGHLCSKNHVPKFYKVDDYAFYDKYVIQNKAPSKSKFDPNIDLVESVEARKKELLSIGGGQLCMNFMESETFGYHPKSFVCKGCSDRFLCNDMLIKAVGFDILSLREVG